MSNMFTHSVMWLRSVALSNFTCIGIKVTCTASRVTKLKLQDKTLLANLVSYASTILSLL